MIGKDGLRELGFVDTYGNFKLYVEEPGLYKIEIFHIKYYFEPVVVKIASEEELIENPSSKLYSAYLYDLKTGTKAARLLYPL